MNIILNWIGTWDWGNVADWVSGIGSIGAILAVWWQSRQEKNLLKMQLENEKEQAFQEKRQLFKLNVAKLRTGGIRSNDYLPIEEKSFDFGRYKINKIDYLADAQIDVVEISNISDRDIIALHVVFIYENDEIIKFNIDSVKSNSKINLINFLKNNFYNEFQDIVHSEISEENIDSDLSFSLENIWKNQLEFFGYDNWPYKRVRIKGHDDLAEKIDKLFKRTSIPSINKSKKIVVYYMTPMREKIRLLFEQNDKGIFHQKNFNMLEHKDGWVTKKGQEKFESFDIEYNLNNFQESKKF